MIPNWRLPWLPVWLIWGPAAAQRVLTRMVWTKPQPRLLQQLEQLQQVEALLPTLMLMQGELALEQLQQVEALLPTLMLMQGELALEQLLQAEQRLLQLLLLMWTILSWRQRWP